MCGKKVGDDTEEFKSACRVIADYFRMISAAYDFYSQLGKFVVL